MGKSARNRTRARAIRQILAHPPRSDWDRMLAGEIGPMNFKGKIMTPEIIEQMRAQHPEHAHQLDDKTVREILENNAPWINDPHFLQRTEALWTNIKHDCPECQQD